MRLKIMASLIMLSVFSTAYAKVVATEGNWALEDTSKRNESGGTCIAFTEIRVGNTDYRLAFYHPKDLSAPTDIYITQDGKGATGWTAVLNNGSTTSFAFSGKTDKTNLLWNIPQDSTAIIEHLEARKKLKVKSADGKEMKLEFSPDGFRKIKEKMQERCLAKAPLIDTEFERSLLPKLETINPMKVTVENIVELRRLIKVGHGVHLKVKDNQVEMGKLRNKFRSQLDEASALNALISRLNDTDIPATIRNGKNNDSLEAAKRDELQRVTRDIVDQKAAVRAAESQLNAARAAIAPFESERESRSSSANSARQAVNQGASRLNSIDQGMASATTRINQLNHEAGSLQENSRRSHSDLQIARNELMRADQDYRSYSPQREVRRRLNHEQAYKDAQKEIPVLLSHIANLDRALSEARGKILAREAELRACLARPVSWVSSRTDRFPAQVERPNRERPNRTEGERPNRTEGERPNRTEGERPNRGDRNPPTTQPTPAEKEPTTPTPATPTPSTPDPSTVDCSSQVEGVRLARAAEADLVGQQREAKQRIENAESRVHSVESRIENEVERERHAMAQAATIASRRVEAIQANLAINEKRLYQITSMEIPQQQNMLRSLENERPGTQSRYNQDLNQAQGMDQDLESFERKVGWDQKISAVESAHANLNSRRSILDNSEALKQNDETIIANCQAERMRLSNELVARQQQKAKSESRLIEVTSSLEPFQLEKGKIEGIESDLKNQLAGLSVEIEGQLTK